MTIQCIICGTKQEIEGHPHPRGAKITIWICSLCIKSLVTGHLFDKNVLRTDWDIRSNRPMEEKSK